MPQNLQRKDIIHQNMSQTLYHVVNLDSFGIITQNPSLSCSVITTLQMKIPVKYITFNKILHHTWTPRYMRWHVISQHRHFLEFFFYYYYSLEITCRNTLDNYQASGRWSFWNLGCHNCMIGLSPDLNLTHFNGLGHRHRSSLLRSILS